MIYKSIDELDELTLEDIEEFDSVLIWDVSEQKTKKVLIQTLMDYLKMINSQ